MKRDKSSATTLHDKPHSNRSREAAATTGTATTGSALSPLGGGISKQSNRRSTPAHGSRPNDDALGPSSPAAKVRSKSPTINGPASVLHKSIMLVAVVLPFLACVLGIAITWQYGFMGWLYLALMIGGWQLTGLGVTIGLHRMATHRSFEAHPLVRRFWLGLGALAIEGSPIVWCATHRKHHEFSDHEGDPHSPHLHDGSTWEMIKGFWHAHTGWLFGAYWTQDDLKRYVPDLLAERWLVRVDRLYYLWVLVSFLIPTAIAGLATWSWQGAALGLLWGGFVRVFITHHVTWSINSVCHVFGSRDFHSNDESTNNTLCALLGMGEGWHNNHHAFPTSARHGLKWWQLDESWLIIRAMQLCGLVWNVKLPTERQMETKAVTATM